MTAPVVVAVTTTPPTDGTSTSGESSIPSSVAREMAASSAEAARAEATAGDALTREAQMRAEYERACQERDQERAKNGQLEAKIAELSAAAGVALGVAASASANEPPPVEEVQVDQAPLESPAPEPKRGFFRTMIFGPV